MNKLPAFFLALAGVFAALGTSHAFTDGYQDRKGVLAGVSLGGGNGKSDFGSADTSATGLLASARVGAGSTPSLSFDMEAAYFGGSDNGIRQKQMGFTANLNKFLSKDIYVRGGLGFASGTLETSPSLADDTQSGTALSLGFGYEIFMNAETALNMGAVYRKHMFDDFDFKYFGLQVGLTWY